MPATYVMATKKISYGDLEIKFTDLVSNQSECIEKLEKENFFLKAELSSLSKKVNDVISENEQLHSGIISKAVEETLQQSHNTSDGTKLLLMNDVNKVIDQKTIRTPESSLKNEPDHDKKMKENWDYQMKEIQSMYQHKIDVLQIEKELVEKQLSEEKDKNQESAKLLENLNYSKHCENQQHGHKNINNNVNSDSDMSDKPSAAIIERLSSENKNLIQTVKDLRRTVITYQEQEGVLRHTIQQGLAAVEEIQLEKMEVSVERDQLKKDLDSAINKMEKTIIETQALVYDASEKQKNAVAAEFSDLQEQLNNALSSNVLIQDAFEKATAENSVLQTKLVDSRNEMIEYERKLAIAHAEIQHDYKITAESQSGAEEQLRNCRAKLESDVAHLNHNNARSEQLCRDLTKRLHVAEENLLNSQQMNISLTEQLNDVKSALNANKISLDNFSKSSTMKFNDMQKQMQMKIDDLSCNWKMSESQYEARLGDLEIISAQQSKLIKDLTKECLDLENVLNTVTDKYRKDVGQLSQDNEMMAIKIHRLTRNNKDLSDQCVKHAKMHKAMQERMSELNFHNVASNGKMLDLLSKSMLLESSSAADNDSVS